MSFMACAAAVKRVQAAEAEQPVAASRERVEEAVKAVATLVENGRQWYAVYRAMVDREVIGKGNYAGFVAMVSDLVPDHEHLPAAAELRRMAVQSFNKPVRLWDAADAPVKGQRFDDYLHIARQTLKMLPARKNSQKLP